jgi:hypothetical protein
MDLKYDILKYIAKTRMSAKKRILVEGRDDKSHIKNLLDVLHKGHKVKIDTAEDIKGVCKVTARNNRAKIDAVASYCKDSKHHKNLFYLCDREYIKFNIDSEVHDLMDDHILDGNLAWTIGHSIENYFFKEDLLSESYRFLCGSAYKSQAIALFRNILPSAFKVVAAISLAARDLNKASYPLGVIGWKNFSLNDNEVNFDSSAWVAANSTEIATEFHSYYLKQLPIVASTNEIICSRICRGHTAMLMLQRIFSACLYQVTVSVDSDLAEKDASNFSKLKENTLANALCESWINQAKRGEGLYPNQLIAAVA